MMVKCIRCDKLISEKRALLAYSRGKQPTFCCEACKNAWHQRERRKAAKEGKE